MPELLEVGIPVGFIGGVHFVLLALFFFHLLLCCQLSQFEQTDGLLCQANTVAAVCNITRRKECHARLGQRGFDSLNIVEGTLSQADLFHPLNGGC